MRLREMQQLIDVWVEENGGYWDVPFNMLRLSEEVGELSREVNHRLGPKKKKATEADKALDDELADVLWVVLCLANQLDVDVETAFLRTMDKLRVRDAGRHTGGERAAPAEDEAE